MCKVLIRMLTVMLASGFIFASYAYASDEELDSSRVFGALDVKGQKCDLSRFKGTWEKRDVKGKLINTFVFDGNIYEERSEEVFINNELHYPRVKGVFGCKESPTPGFGFFFQEATHIPSAHGGWTKIPENIDVVEYQTSYEFCPGSELNLGGGGCKKTTLYKKIK